MNSVFDRCSPRQTGFSVVELMIAMVLGLAVVAAVGTLSLNATRSYRTLDQANQQLESGRYALAVLRNDLEHAGYYGIISPLTLKPATSDPGDPCNLDPQSHAATLLMPIRGFDNYPSSNCQSLGMKWLVPNTSVLVVRRAETATTPVDSLTTGNTYIQATLESYVLGCAGCATNAANFSLKRQDDLSSLADIRRYHVHIYYIRSSSSSGVNDGIPTLVRMSLSNKNNAPSMETDPLVEGIENMQVQYGLDAPLGEPCPLTDLASNAHCNGTPDVYVPSAAASLADMGWADWANVVTVRIVLLARSLGSDHDMSDQKVQDATYTDTKTYNLGTVTVVAMNDHYRRHVYSQVVRIHHPAYWRDREQ